MDKYRYSAKKMGTWRQKLHLSRLDLPHAFTRPHEANKRAIAHEIVHLLYALAHSALIVLAPLFPRACDLFALLLSDLVIVEIRILDA